MSCECFYSARGNTTPLRVDVAGAGELGSGAAGDSRASCNQWPSLKLADIEAKGI